MIRFIYIHPKSTDIKNELHKKIIFRDNSRPCNPMIIFLTHVFLNSLFSVAGLFVVFTHLALHRIQDLSPVYTKSRVGVPPHFSCRGEYSFPASALCSFSWLCFLLVTVSSYRRLTDRATSELLEAAQDTVAGVRCWPRGWGVGQGPEASHWPWCPRRENSR